MGIFWDPSKVKGRGRTSKALVKGLLKINFINFYFELSTSSSWRFS